MTTRTGGGAGAAAARLPALAMPRRRRRRRRRRRWRDSCLEPVLGGAATSTLASSPSMKSWTSSPLHVVRSPHVQDGVGARRGVGAGPQRGPHRLVLRLHAVELHEVDAEADELRDDLARGTELIVIDVYTRVVARTSRARPASGSVGGCRGSSARAAAPQAEEAPRGARARARGAGAGAGAGCAMATVWHRWTSSPSGWSCAPTAALHMLSRGIGERLHAPLHFGRRRRSSASAWRDKKSERAAAAHLLRAGERGGSARASMLVVLAPSLTPRQLPAASCGATGSG